MNRNNLSLRFSRVDAEIAGGNGRLLAVLDWSLSAAVMKSNRGRAVRAAADAARPLPLATLVAVRMRGEEGVGVCARRGVLREGPPRPPGGRGRLPHLEATTDVAEREAGEESRRRETDECGRKTVPHSTRGVVVETEGPREKPVPDSRMLPSLTAQLIRTTRTHAVHSTHSQQTQYARTRGIKTKRG